jgi:quercetin dioxygenase-like cupin family protein
MNELNLKESFGTLSETINGLVKLGYTYDFNVKMECIICPITKMILSPDDFQIDKTYRFEGSSDPEYQSILYAISSTKHELKGTLVNGYGISSDDAAAKLVEKLEINKVNSIIRNTSNDAALKRPDGERMLNASMVDMNLNQFIEQLKNEVTWANSDRNSLTLFKSESMSIVLIGMHASTELKTHKANGMLSIQVLEGKIIFIAEQQSSLFDKGQIIALQENIPHSVKALAESFLLLTLVLNKNLKN